MTLVPTGLVVGAAIVVAAQALVVRPAVAPLAVTEAGCDPARRCEFRDGAGVNAYRVTTESLARTHNGEEVYRLTIAGGAARAVMAAMTPERSQLAVVVRVESVPTAALFSPGQLLPGGTHRTFTVFLHNPKSGAVIKTIGFGMLAPVALVLSSDGAYLWVDGQDAQLRRREIRAYNTRSGAVAFSTVVPGNARSVRLLSGGYEVDGVGYRADSATVDQSARIHLSTNPYSIAEFVVSVAAPIRVETIKSASLGVVGVVAESASLQELLEATIVSRLAGAGLHVVERRRMKDLLQELQLQNLGLTDSASAAQLGRLANAQFLVFGETRALGASVTGMTLRMVAVETGTVVASVDLECRDCRDDDLVQGLRFMIGDWVVRP